MLEKLDSPEYLKTLDDKGMEELCGEIRKKIIETVSRNGGHLAPNLGTVELITALHKVFDCPEDKIFFDVGHQSYPHKLLTGRAKDFPTLRLDDGLSGFPSRSESPYDAFVAGHAGTAISAAMGFAAERDLRKGNEQIIAVVGDGSLINGVTLEALNNVRSSCKNLIIVLNDNKMSISSSVGALRHYLNRIITGSVYNRFKAAAKVAVKRLPSGKGLIGNIQKMEAAIKSLIVPGFFFEELGIRYVGPVNGHDIPELVKTFSSVKNFNRPVLVHVITQKGYGCDYAVKAPERYHGISAFDPDTGLAEPSSKKTFSAVFGETLCKEAEKDSKIVAVTAAMPSGTGLSGFAKRFPERFFDTGITEGHAMTFAAGLAASGMKAVIPMYATFLQRALDNVFHDICLQDLPAVICADRAGLVEDGPTHHGFSDLPFLLSMPLLSILAPRDPDELSSMLPAALKYGHPVLLRYPRGSCDLSGFSLASTPVQWGKGEILKEGKDLLIWAMGKECRTALEIREILKKKNISCTVVNGRFYKPFDKELFLSFAEKMPVVTIEDALAGTGIDAITDSLLVQKKYPFPVIHFSWQNTSFLPHGTIDGIRKKFSFTAEKMAEKLLEELQKKNG
ncbi:MAG: 1-deoxy-D-xylulose-5-phosphate synthase [Lentisphaeria bacterium]|nr:1-deoxy-D-xylulose-5-phosphate synthase [Lentisphaeria bacterium]